jgi:hypothetical protein
MTHPLERDLNAPAADILSAIQKGFRAIIDVKGKLAEFYFDKQLAELQRTGMIDSYTWSDTDGEADFVVVFKGKKLVVECKNIRSKELFKNPTAYKVELQRTRNSKDGTNTRGYRADEFEILAACLFNHTKQWEYRHICTRNLERRDDQKAFLKIMQRVPLKDELPWHSNLMEALKEAVAE